MRKRIVGFTGNRAELFIQSNLFISLSNSKDIAFELIAYDNGKDDAYTKQLINLQNNGVKLAQVITETEGLDENNIHNETMVKIMSSIDKNIINEIDLGIVYADRYESFGFAIRLFNNKIPLLHLEAGDITQGGTLDDSVRHAISRLCSLFATSTLHGQKFLVESNEEEWRILHCGLLSYGSIFQKRSIKKREQKHPEPWLNTRNPIIVCTMHSVPQLKDKGIYDAEECFSAIESLSKKYESTTFIITSPNPDEGGILIQGKIDIIEKTHNIKIIKSLGESYYDLLSQAKNRKIVLIGNSSSIIKEAPFFNTYHINVGNRQLGRLSASSQINIKPIKDEIESTVANILDGMEIQPKITVNPYHVKEDPVLKLVEWIKYILNLRSKSQLLVKNWV